MPPGATRTDLGSLVGSIVSQEPDKYRVTRIVRFFDSRCWVDIAGDISDIMLMSARMTFLSGATHSVGVFLTCDQPINIKRRREQDTSQRAETSTITIRNSKKSGQV